jgi:arabinogalactan oligomer/maltooligosaccharide transport system substrate-binding protein
MKVKKVFGFILVLLTAAFVFQIFYGCKKSSKIFGEKKIFLTVWEAIDGPDLFIKQAAKIYSAKNPHVAVNFVHVDPTDVVSRMKDDAVRGIGPDLFSSAHDNLGVLVSGGLVSPAKFSSEVQQKVLSSCSKAVTYDRKIYGYPVSAETYALFYNKSLISENEVPSTWENLVEWTKKFNEAHPEKHGFVMDVSNVYYTFIFTTKNGNRLFGQNGNDSSRANINTPSSVDGMKFFQSLKNVVRLPSSQMNSVAADASFQSGNAAMCITGPWNIKNFSDAGIRFGVASIPSLPGESQPASSFSGTRAMFVSAYSEHPDEANDFAEFLISPEMQQLRFKLTGAMPSVNTQVDSQYIRGFLKQLEVAFPMPSIPEMGSYWLVMNAVSGRIWDGSDVQTELDKAQKEIVR